MASKEELEEGLKQMEEAEKRMRSEGLEVFDPRRPAGSDGQFLGAVSSEEVAQHPVGRPEVFAPPSGQTGGTLKQEGEVGGRHLLPEILDKEAEESKGGRGEEKTSPVEPPGLGNMLPLFDDEQLRRFEELYRDAPMLHPREGVASRPEGMRAEQERQDRREGDLQRLIWNRIQVLEARAEETSKANEELKKSNQQIREENRVMKERIRNFMMPYDTPEVKKGRGSETEAAGWTEAADFHGKKEEDKKQDAGSAASEEVWVTPRKGESSRGDEKESPGGQKAVVQSMLKLMEGMHALQVQIAETKKTKEVEVVKNYVGELPKLPDWRAESAPLDLTDWLLTIEPTMSDLSDNSQSWWESILKTIREWYSNHLELSPLERVEHRPELPEELRGHRFSRLEKRATHLLMQAIPGHQQEEVIAGKDVNVLSILGRLMLCYQPGGLSEKSAILTALDSPEEAQSLSQAVGGLRKWLRWHRRAGEVGVVRPDATLQAKGLGRLMKKVLKDNPDLGFRVALAKSSLQIDTTPTESSIMKFAHHMLAEVEQIAHQDKKKKEQSVGGESKMKRFEEGGGKKGDGKGEKGEKGSGGWPCKFFLTEEGCKKGKGCSWVHQLDDRRRCWTCGSLQHLAPACDRPKEAENRGKGGDNPKGLGKSSRVLKKDEEQEVREKEAEGSKSESVASESMMELLEEANKMIKSLSTKNEGLEEGRDKKLAAMQHQIDKLKKMKVLRLTRLEKGAEEKGLLDSGATHPMRSRRKDENVERYEKVKVTMANGEKVEMRMTTTGIMVCEDEDVEPIVPMSALVEKLGYAISWTEDGMTMTHPNKKKVKVKILNGCPQVSKKEALKMIKELEEDKRLRRMSFQEIEEEKWLRQLVEAHPVLRTLPLSLRQDLVDCPADSLRRIPNCNRRMRKRLRQGFVVHLFAGEKDGYTLSRAFKENGGDQRRLVEIDVKREESQDGSHDVLKNQGVYSALLRAALDNQVRGVVMGPNCRTRSVLRHYPLDVPGGGPKPLRSWNEPWGMDAIPEKEKIKVQEDDLMMWRGLFLYIVAEEMRSATMVEGCPEVKLGLEQPAAPEHKPEVVSFWGTKEWLNLKKMYGLTEQSFDQSQWGGIAFKPTTFAGNLKLDLPEEEVKRKKESTKVKDSKLLSRWAPGFMREVAKQIQKQIFKGEVKLRMVSWTEHVRQGHVPFRRDCQICQEASARGRMHFKMGFAKAGVMSLDVSGPYHLGHDLLEEGKFMLIGSYTWVKPKGGVDEEGLKLEDGDEDREGEEVGPMLEVEEDVPEIPQLEEDLVEERMLDEERRVEGEDEEKKDEEEKIEGRVDPDIRVLKIGIPLAAKTKEAVLDGMIDLYIQLRTEGYPISTIHTDKGREFVNGKVRSWMRSRGILHSTNSGEDPKGNGRAERIVGEVKSRVRRVLHASGMSVVWWPMALRYVMEMERKKRMGEKVKTPEFGAKVLVKKRNWRTQALEPTHEPTKYLTPVPQSHGHCVLRENGRWVVAPYVIRNVEQPPPPTDEMWLAIVEEIEKDEIQERRRIRGKHPSEHKRREEALGLRMFIEEEAKNIKHDEMENAVRMFQKLDGVKKDLKKLESEEEEILQTKIISTQELVRDIGLWDEAIQSEMKSLLDTKKALKIIGGDEKKHLEEKHPDLLVVPSKLVVTRKAGGRRKVRIVACGNYIEKDNEEDLYAGGSDSISLRVSLKKAMVEGWTGASADIRTAFLNAPLPREDQDNTLVILKPPALLQRLGYVGPQDYWMALMAMYGLRQSPKTWSTHRDTVLMGLSWELDEEKFYMEPTISEPNLWRILRRGEEGGDDQVGLMIVYVDDLLILGSEGLVSSCLKRIEKEWELSQPEWLSSKKPLKFLGVELWEFEEGIFINQENYLVDVLRRHGEENGLKSGIPITKDQVQRLDNHEDEKKPEDVRLAQKLTGELMWMLTKSRPDLMFLLAKMSQSTLRSPREVVNVAKQALRYLRKTASEGLWLRRKKGEDVEVYTDSSYGPNGMDSQGCVIVCYGGDAVMWKSSRQSTPALSTAESELLEAIEGLTMGDSVDVLIQEISNTVGGKKIRVDNMAAVNLLVESAGSWRTRHLRLRAAHLRWRLGRLDWLVEQIPGAEQLADIGTKMMSSPKLESMKRMLNMGRSFKKEEDVEEDEVEEEEGERDQEEEVGQRSKLQERIEDAEKLVKMVMLMTILDKVKAEEEKEEEEVWSWAKKEILGLAVVWVAIYAALQVLWWMAKKLWKKIKGERKEQPEEEPGVLEEESEEVQQSEGDQQSPPRVEDPQLESQERLSRVRRRIEEEEVRSEEHRGARRMREGQRNQRMIEGGRSQQQSTAASSQAVVVINHWEPTDQFLRGRGPAFITTFGVRWHPFSNCPRLSQRTSPLVSSRWCPHCAARPIAGNVAIYSLGRGEEAHYDRHCPHLRIGSQKFMRCLVCAEMEL